MACNPSASGESGAGVRLAGPVSSRFSETPDVKVLSPHASIHVPTSTCVSTHTHTQVHVYMHTHTLHIHIYRTSLCINIY